MVIEKMLAFDVMTVPFSYLCRITSFYCPHDGCLQAI